MPQTTFQPKEIFDQHLDQIRQMAYNLAIHKGFSHEDSEDFVSDLIVKLMDDDFKVIAKFNQKADFLAYISVVIANTLADERNRKWGKFRPSEDAKRLGGEAVALETLTVRDGHSRDVAIQILAQRDASPQKERHLHNLFGFLPNRFRRSYVPSDVLTYQPDHRENIESALSERDEAQRLQKAGQVVSQELQQLESADRLLIRWVYVERLKVAHIARQQNVPARQLYAKLNSLMVRFRNALSQAGLL